MRGRALEEVFDLALPLGSCCPEGTTNTLLPPLYFSTASQGAVTEQTLQPHQATAFPTGTTVN